MTVRLVLRENTKQFLLDHPDVATEIENTVRAQAGLAGPSANESEIPETPETEIAAKA